MARFDAPDLDVRTKADASPVTEADLATERAIRAMLEAERPADGIFGEEFGVSGDSARQWIIDPIDGTANYLKGIPMWSTLIALSIDGVPRVGVVSQPAIGRRWWAASGLGAWTNTVDGGPRRISVSAVDARRRGERQLPEHRAVAGCRSAGRARAPDQRRVARPRLRRRLALHAARRGTAGVRRRVRRQGVRPRRPRADHHRGRRPLHLVQPARDSIAERSSLATNGILHQAFLDILHSPAPTEPPR